MIGANLIPPFAVAAAFVATALALRPTPPEPEVPPPRPLGFDARLGKVARCFVGHDDTSGVVPMRIDTYGVAHNISTEAFPGWLRMCLARELGEVRLHAGAEARVRVFLRWLDGELEMKPQVVEE